MRIGACVGASKIIQFCQFWHQIQINTKCNQTSRPRHHNWQKEDAVWENTVWKCEMRTFSITFWVHHIQMGQFGTIQFEKIQFEKNTVCKNKQFVKKKHTVCKNTLENLLPHCSPFDQAQRNQEMATSPLLSWQPLLYAIFESITITIFTIKKTPKWNIYYMPTNISINNNNKCKIWIAQIWNKYIDINLVGWDLKDHSTWQRKKVENFIPRDIELAMSPFWLVFTFTFHIQKAKSNPLKFLIIGMHKYNV